MTLFIKTNSNALTVLETTPLPDLLTVRQTSEILGVASAYANKFLLGN